LTLLTGWALVAIIAATDLDAGETKAAWQAEWEKIVQAAKKEGQVTVYVHSTYAPALESGAFQKAFPDIKLVLVSGVELQLERRFMAERRAGKSLADVFMVGVLRSYDFYQAKLLEPIKAALVLPEVVDESKWWQKTHHYADPEKAYLFRYVGSAQLGQIHYNTRLVGPKEFNSF
jgi:ABC-type glycerol-3-phosphate transport system substrate-binding protein